MIKASKKREPHACPNALVTTPDSHRVIENVFFVGRVVMPATFLRGLVLTIAAGEKVGQHRQAGVVTRVDMFMWSRCKNGSFDVHSDATKAKVWTAVRAVTEGGD